MTSATRANRAAVAPAVCMLALAACAATPAPRPQVFHPPQPLALIAIVDPSPAAARDELRQLAAVVQAGVTPSQALVVTLLAGAPSATSYTVRRGDTLSSIAAGRGLALASLESANPQLGPLAGRDWNHVYPGDRVTVPAAAGTPAGGNAIVTRAPAGPPPPDLVPVPAPPTNPTEFQDAQFRRAQAAARAANEARAAAWRARAATQLAPWQAGVIAQIQQLAGSLTAAAPAASGPDGRRLGGAVLAAANTLAGLPGRRVLLVLAGGLLDGSSALAPDTSLARVHLVVANLPVPAPAFTASAAAAGALVTALDPALTVLELAAAVNG